MALELLDESFVHRYADKSDNLMSHRYDSLGQLDTSEWSDGADWGYFRRLDRGSAGFLLLMVILIGGIPAALFAQAPLQQDVSQPMQELQDQWREIMKKEYNPSANGVMQPARRSAEPKTSEAAQKSVETESERSISLEASGQSSPPERKVRAGSSRGTQRSSKSIGRSKYRKGRSSGSVSGSAGKTSMKRQASSRKVPRKAVGSGTASKTQTRNPSVQSKSKAIPDKTVRAEKPVSAIEGKSVPGKMVGTSKQKSASTTGVVSPQQKTAPADSSRSSQKKKMAAKTAGTSQINKKSGR
jgi:hypothetical protein